MRNRGRRGEGEDFARKNTEALPPLVGRGSGERNRHTPNVAASQASLFPLCKLISTIAGEIVRRVKKLFKILNAGRKRRGGVRRATVDDAFFETSSSLPCSTARPCSFLQPPILCLRPSSFISCPSAHCSSLPYAPFVI